MASTSGTWSPARLQAHRRNHSATHLPDGEVLLVGGGGRSETKSDGVCNFDDPRSHHSAEIFDPTTAQSRPAFALAAPREGHHAQLLVDGSVLIFGGHGGDGGDDDDDRTATCAYTNDGICDEPHARAPGADWMDCNTCASTNDGVCDDPTGTGLCPAGTDAVDCATNPDCPYTNDGECDEPEGSGLCPEGTDVNDCA